MDVPSQTKSSEQQMAGLFSGRPAGGLGGQAGRGDPGRPVGQSTAFASRPAGLVARVWLAALVLAGIWTAGRALHAERAPATQPAASRPADAVAAQFDGAVQAVREHRLKDAELMLESVIQQDPTQGRAYRVLAYVYELESAQAKGNVSDPRAKQEAEELQKKAISSYLRAADLAQEAGNTVVVEQVLTRILSLNPSHPDAQLGLARVLAATNRGYQAIERYKEYLKNPHPEQQSAAYLELAKAYLNAKYYIQAQEALEEAASLDPTNAEVDINLARVFFGLQQTEKAQAAIDSALKKAPHNPELYYSAALLRLDQNEPRLAVTAARTAIELSKQVLAGKPDDAQLLEKMTAYFATYNKALQALLAKEGNSAEIRIEMARAVEDQGAVAQQLSYHYALQLLGRIPPDQQNKLEVLQQRASLQVNAFMFAQAAETYQRILKLDPKNAVARKTLETVKARAVPTSGTTNPAGTGKP